MKEYIEKIIEIILEDVSCEHRIEEEYSGGPAFDDVAYSLKDEKMVIEKCIEAIPARLIERPEITEEWMKKKIRQLSGMSLIACKGVSLRSTISIKEAEIFLSSLLDELAAKISLIGKEKKDLE